MDGIGPFTEFVVVVNGGPVAVVEVGVVICLVGVGSKFGIALRLVSSACCDIFEPASDSSQNVSVKTLTSCTWVSLISVT